MALSSEIRLDQEESPVPGLGVLDHEAGIRDDPVFGSLREINEVRGLTNPMGSIVVPTVLNEGRRHPIIVPRFDRDFDGNQNVECGQPMIHLRRPAIDHIDVFEGANRETGLIA